MVKSMSQLFVIGGTYPDTDNCDLAYDTWGAHSFWTGTYRNAGNSSQYWNLYDPTATTNAVPVDVYNVTGGSKDGGATLKEPKAGFDTGNEGLEKLLALKPSIPERSVACQTRCPTKSPTPTADPTADPTQTLSTGVIVGISVGGTVALLSIVSAWFCIRRRFIHRREERCQAQSSYVATSEVAPVHTVNPSRPSELHGQHIIGELP
jgi:hypothetical protein